MTLSELRTRCLERLDEVEGGLRWSSSDLNNYLNLAYQTVCVRTGNLVKTATITAVAYQMKYDLPTDCVTPIRLYRDSPLEKVWPTAPRRLDDRVRNWRKLTGTRWEWYFMFGLDQIFAGPAYTTSGETYTLTYNADPTRAAMSSDSDSPDFPRRFHEILVDYAVARALIVDADGERLKQAAESFSEFQNGIRDLRKSTQKHYGRLHQMRDEDPDGMDFGVYS